MSELSKDAIRVLRTINERGLTVLWSYRVPHPEYGDGEKMPDQDWRIIETELSRVEQRREYVPTPSTEYVKRTSITNGMIVKQTFLVRDDKEYPSPLESAQSGFADTPDAVLSEERWVEQDGEWIQYSQWVSEYLTREKIDQDDVIEEFVGLLDRYSLTDKALEVIA